MNIRRKSYDLVVAGVGAAGVGAAISAAKNGLKTLLVEAGAMVGDDLVCGLPWNGCFNARGELIVGGVAKELWTRVKAEGGYVKQVFDWRLINSLCIDHRMMQAVITDGLSHNRVDAVLYSTVKAVIQEGRRVTGVMVETKKGQTLVEADWFIDCTGDGDLAIMAGAECEKGGPGGAFQPVSIVFQLAGVDFVRFLEFVRDNSQHFILGESPITRGKSKAECAAELCKAGNPFAGLDGKGEFVQSAVAAGELSPCGAAYV